MAGGYVAYTNVPAMNAGYYSTTNKTELDKSLARLASGLRINDTADDTAGAQVANALRSQTSSLGQASKNANEAIGIIKIADRAMEEQIKILDLIKTKAVQAAQDGQTDRSRRALQDDVTKLLEELDNIALNTSYNGKSLLSGAFANKEFQIGAYSNESVKASIGSSVSSKLGNTRFETSADIDTAGVFNVGFANLSNGRTLDLGSFVLSTSTGTGIGQIAATINNNSDNLDGIKAVAQVYIIGRNPVVSAQSGNFSINGVTIGDVTVKRNDEDGALVAAINDHKAETGVEAFVENGVLTLNSIDGRGIDVDPDPAQADLTIINRLFGTTGANADTDTYFTRYRGGVLTLIKPGASDIVTTGNLTPLTTGGYPGINFNLKTFLSGSELSSSDIQRTGYYADLFFSGRPRLSGVLTKQAAQITMDIVDSALLQLEDTRASLGSAQQQIEVAIRNISTSKTNVKASESQIRDADFAKVSSEYQRRNILAQTGSYALTQANNANQLLLKLLQ